MDGLVVSRVFYLNPHVEGPLSIFHQKALATNLQGLFIDFFCLIIDYKYFIGAYFCN